MPVNKKPIQVVSKADAPCIICQKTVFKGETCMYIPNQKVCHMACFKQYKPKK